MKVYAALPSLASAEQGLADFEAPTWFAVFLPRGASEPIIRKLNQAACRIAVIDLLSEHAPHTPDLQSGAIGALGAMTPGVAVLHRSSESPRRSCSVPSMVRPSWRAIGRTTLSVASSGPMIG